ncbi:YARHG domain-containing protein [Sphingobacterium sp. 18053]|uniref:YARHG domain-containing protein n=1 Tax=Sphingobacterium sp. 18053 TaxID=2681401 RepID=UPI00135874C1|nr:YARHG domain-containing protein [Sphingobacterium sp. 18053]
MRKNLCLMLMLGAILGCKDGKSKKNEATETKDTVVAEAEAHQELYGNWVGEFVVDESTLEEGEGLPTTDYSPKINLTIKKITDKGNIFGQNVVKGNLRSFVGKLEENGADIRLLLDEPGDKKSDGRFEIKLNHDTLIGNWTAYDQGLKIKKRSFKLLKKQFAYNPNLMLKNQDGEDGTLVDWINEKRKEETDVDGDSTYTYIIQYYRSASPAVFTVNASKQKLTEKDLKNLKKLDLEIIRNTIFARHGYAFTKPSIRQFFEPVDWYVPISKDVTADLSPLEKDNIALLTRFEKYATDNYDTFGR